MSQFRLETEADMLNYLDKDYGHGVGATYTRSGTASSISVILNNEFILQDEGIGLEALKPVAHARSVDVPNASFGDLLNVEAIKDVDGNTLKAAQNYTIVNVQKDRTGFSSLILEEV